MKAFLKVLGVLLVVAGGIAAMRVSSANMGTTVEAFTGQGSGWHSDTSPPPSEGIRMEEEMVAPDGVTHLCKVTIGPILTDASGAQVRPVTLVGLFLHTSGSYVGIVDSPRVIPATGSQGLSYAMGPFSGTASDGTAWTGIGMKRATITPVSGKTWATIQSRSDLDLALSVD